jgi:hypothetical protein
MSTLKKMPNENSMRAFRYSIWFFVIVVCFALAYFKKYGNPTSLPVAEILVGVLVVGIVAAMFIEHYCKTRQRCPDCGKSMREVYEDVHPKAEDYHILYCESCDLIWDTTIPKSNG